ncbi:MAG: potassium channel protein [Gemmataceae bacterium]
MWVGLWHVRAKARRVWRATGIFGHRRLVRPLLFPAGLLLVGTVGYPLIEGPPWTPFDGLYMTVITLCTIGYGETHPLSTAGRVFTIFLSFGGIFTLGYFATEVVRAVVSGELQDLLGRQRMEEELAALSGHTVVCGFGRMGRIVCDELDRQRERFVVIDTAPAAGGWGYRHGVRLQGNATEDEVLRRAGTERAKALITALGSDADNLYITLSSRLLNPKLCIVARAEEEQAEGKLRKVGATKVISPYLAGGHRAVQAVLRPTVLQLMETATRPEFAALQLEEIKVAPNSRLANRPVREARLAPEGGLIVVAVQPPASHELEFAPPGDLPLAPGSVIVALGRRDQLDRLEKLATTPG